MPGKRLQTARTGRPLEGGSISAEDPSKRKILVHPTRRLPPGHPGLHRLQGVTSCFSCHVLAPSLMLCPHVPLAPHCSQSPSRLSDGHQRPGTWSISCAYGRPSCLKNTGSASVPQALRLHTAAPYSGVHPGLFTLTCFYSLTVYRYYRYGLKSVILFPIFTLFLLLFTFCYVHCLT